MIGLIAGQGDLPQTLINHWSLNNQNFCVIGFKANLSLPPNIPYESFPLGYIGAILDFFKKNNVHHIVMAGSMKRPALKDLSLDSTGVKWLAKLGSYFLKGDDGLLKKIMQLLEDEGFTIKSPQDYLNNLLTPLGCLTQKRCEKRDDIKLGFRILSLLSEFDIGQAVIVHEGRVMGIEGIEGTEKLIERCPPHGMLIKAAKTQQTLVVDTPSIGPDTILKGKHLDGIILQANKTQIIDKERVLQLCKEYDLFLEGV